MIKRKILITIIILLIFVGGGLYIYQQIKPMLVDGHIVELKGYVQEINDNYIMLLESNNEGLYKCEISKHTYFPNNYEPNLKDYITVIYDYDKKLIDKNKKAEIKIVNAKRIYKNKK